MRNKNQTISFFEIGVVYDRNRYSSDVQTGAYFSEYSRLMHELCKCFHWCQNSTRLHSLVISLEYSAFRHMLQGRAAHNKQAARGNLCTGRKRALPRISAPREDIRHRIRRRDCHSTRQTSWRFPASRDCGPSDARNRVGCG